MPVKEASFRIGCGRYLQEAGILSKLGCEIKRHGESALIIGGKTALEITRTRIEEAVALENCRYEIIEHRGTCNDERAKELADLCKAKNYDVIVGVGGGVICDFAKVCGYFAKKPVINVPTSSATCACYTPLSVRYTPDGKTVGSLHYDYEVDAVLADTEIISKQPVRLLLAGVFDALAKFIEIKQRFNENITEGYAMGLDYAYIMSKYSYKLLCDKVEQCIADMQKGEITETVENVIFTTLAATGVISGIARGSNQCAAAHKFYEITRILFNEEARPYLHGELVGIGLILQNYHNGEEANNDALIALMKKYGMPSKITDVGITANEDTLEEYYKRLCNSSSVNRDDPSECKAMHDSLEYLWSIK